MSVMDIFTVRVTIPTNMCVCSLVCDPDTPRCRDYLSGSASDASMQMAHCMLPCIPSVSCMAIQYAVMHDEMWMLVSCECAGLYRACLKACVWLCFRGACKERSDAVFALWHGSVDGQGILNTLACDKVCKSCSWAYLCCSTCKSACEVALINSHP